MHPNKHKFIDPMHENTEDGFVIETDYKGRKFVRVFQEMASGELRNIYLSPNDIKQIHAHLVVPQEENK